MKKKEMLKMIRVLQTDKNEMMKMIKSLQGDSKYYHKKIVNIEIRIDLADIPHFPKRKSLEEIMKEWDGEK